MMINLIEADLIPMPLWEADCTKRLEVIRDIPVGKCIYWFERTDMVRAFEVLGDVVALRGNISPSLLTTGKPEDVDDAVRHLAQNVFHKGGKLILDAAFGLPDETPVENVRTMYSAARKYSS
jgi:uroporphyrinogen-III decarboxylase